MRYLVVALLGLASCLPQNSATDATGRSMAMSGSGQGNTNVFDKSLPNIVYGEDILVREERTYRVLGKDGLWDSFFEEFSSDGSSQFALELVQVAMDDASVPVTPSLYWLDAYATRDRYMTKFRDPHLGEEATIRQNYLWRSLPGLRSIAGRDCLKFRAESNYGFGSFEFYIDNQNDHLLGWQRIDPTGALAAEMEVTTVNYAPTFTNQVWSQPMAPERDYDQLNDDVLLGITPQRTLYLPLGFTLNRQRFVDAEQVFGTLVPNLYFEHYSDGIQNMFVVQSKITSAAAPKADINFANRADLGGVRIVEGQVADGQVYVVGSLPRQELLAVYGAMQK